MSNMLTEVQEFYKSAVFNCWLTKRGADVLGDIISRHSATKDTEPSKHYKCPVCNTRFTREYPYKPSDTKEVKDTEPLAVLADRKGMWVQQIHTKGKWWFDIFENLSEGIDGSSPEFTCGIAEYAAAEAKAREYLEGLEDKK